MEAPPSQSPFHPSSLRSYSPTLREVLFDGWIKYMSILVGTAPPDTRALVPLDRGLSRMQNRTVHHVLTNFARRW